MKKHKKVQKRKDFFFYNKQNELVRLVEKSDDGSFFRLREIIDNAFITYLRLSEKRGKPEIIKEIRTYPHKCHFNHLVTQGENYLLPVEKGKFLHNGYAKYTKSFSKVNDSMETFTIKQELFDKALKSLKK